jgi:pimeloyl-ACP methyl ester carboxylesterase
MVVGCDLGAVIALRIALDQPEFVGRLLLISPASIQDLPGAQIRMMQRETARHVLQLVRGLFGAEPLIRSILEGSVVDPTTLSPRLVARFVAPYLGRDGVNHLLSLTRALEDEDLSDVSLAAIKQPTLVLRGDADRWCTPTHVRKLVESLPNARPLVVPNAARLVVEEAPEAVVSAIEAHVASEKTPA